MNQLFLSIKLPFLCILLLFLLYCQPPTTPPQPLPPPFSYGFTGILTDSTTTAPIESASVSIKMVGDTIRYTILTDSNGVYQFNLDSITTIINKDTSAVLWFAKLGYRLKRDTLTNCHYRILNRELSSYPDSCKKAGTVFFTSLPPVAKVYFDGIYIGQSNRSSLPVLSGKHTVTGSKGIYEKDFEWIFIEGVNTPFFLQLSAIN